MTSVFSISSHGSGFNHGKYSTNLHREKPEANVIVYLHLIKIFIQSISTPE